MLGKIHPHLNTGLYFLCLITLYSWPLWWNSWPLIFNDSASYLNTAEFSTAFSYQSPGYGLFLHLLLRIIHIPEIIPLAQATLVVVSLWNLGRTLKCRPKNRFIIIILFGLITPTPLMCSMILPDALFFAGTASLISLILNPRDRKKIGPLVLVTIAMNIHLATGILYLAMLILSHQMLRVIRRKNQITFRTGQLIITLTLLFVGTQFCLRALYPRESVSIWPIHLTAQLVDNNGYLIKELEAVCPEHTYSLCPLVNDIKGSSADYFLWNKSQPVQKYFGNWTYTPEDWAELIWRTVADQPGEIASWALKRWRYQIFTYNVGYEYSSVGWDSHVATAVEKVFGKHELNRWINSRQEEKWFNPLPNVWQVLFTISGYVGHIAPILLWLLWRRDQRRPLAKVLLIIVLLNALVMSVASYPHARYQMRIHYLPLIVLALAAAGQKVSTPLPSVRNRSSKGL